MNTRAAELGMEDTHFSNTHGYHDDDHYTSAYDIYLMCREAMKHETFRTIVGSKNYTMPATNLHPEPPHHPLHQRPDLQLPRGGLHLRVRNRHQDRLHP